MEYPIAGLITAVVVMLTALLFKRSNPVFWGVIAILLFMMFMGLFVLGASVAARRWMDSGSSEIILAVLAGIVTAGTSIIAMVTQKKRRANWRKYGRGRSHRRSRRNKDGRIADAGDPSEDADDHAENGEPPSLRDLARAFSATRAGEPTAPTTAGDAVPAPPAQATPVETSTVAAAEAEAPPAVPEPPPAGPSPTASPVAPPAGQVAGAVAMESSPASGTNSPPPATAAPAPAPAGNPAPMAEAATESLPPKAGAKLILKAPSKDWMLKAEEASEAMQGVDMREAKNLSEDDIRTLQELQQTVGDLLRMYSALKG